MKLITKGNKLDKEIKPSKQLQNILDKYNVSYHKLDLESLQQQRKDFTTKQFKVFVTDMIRDLSPLDKNKIYAIENTKEDKDYQDYCLQEQIKAELNQKNEKIKNIITESQKSQNTANIKLIKKEISDYSLFCEKLTYSTLLAISMKKSIINVGEKGLSKSRCTKELLNLLEIPFIELKGHLSPKHFFSQLKTYSDSDTVIIIDESFSLLQNKECLNLLLSALQKEDIYWQEDKCLFNGTIIFNSNYISNSPIMEAVKDRCIYNIISLNSEQIKQKILSKKDYKFNKELWTEIRNRIFKCEQTNFNTDKIYQIIENSNPVSVREDEKLILLGKLSHKLFNDLSVLDYFINIDKLSIIINSDIENSEKVKQIAKLKKCSVRNAQKIVKKDLIRLI